jgi:RimJ/RimL family protein N-acetyltransferase/ribosomal protein S18 acetylase RimI-like enzyme
MLEMTALVRSAYQRLADMGLQFMGTWQSEDDTRERCVEGHCLVAEHEGRLVGTVTVRNPDCEEDPEWYRRKGVWVIGQFAVSPELQNGGLGSKLMLEAEGYAFSNGGTEVAIDTAESAAHLIDFYRKRGYRLVGTVDWDGTNYVSVIMSKRIRPELTTERLTLRELCAEDVPIIQSHWADERFQSAYPPGRLTPEHCKEVFEQELDAIEVYPRTGYHWAIVKDAQMIGTIRLTFEKSETASIGYGLAADHWGQGIATEAVREVLRYAFEEVGLHRLQAFVYAPNNASRNVLEKCGFTYEGAMREKIAWGDSRVDDNIYGLLRTEWNSD